uniref:Uncharacterized protein n=1 Tax=Caenorhabditis japonica TaxID=281687 RepID=A0A8R1EE51_CAEJA
MAQMDIASMRADIISERHNIDINFIKAVRVPLPENPTNPSNLLVSLQLREGFIRENYVKMFELIAKSHPDDLQLRYTHNATMFLDIRGIIRRKKRNVMELMINADQAKVVEHLHVIGILSAMEAQLLILMKAQAEFVDNVFGMYGKILPRKMFRLMRRILIASSVEDPVPKYFDIWLDELHGVKSSHMLMVNEHVRGFYLNFEAALESVFQGKVDYENDGGRYRIPYEFVASDFPAEMSNSVPQMVKNSRMEQHELERLVYQLCEVRHAKTAWPKEKWVRLMYT